MEQILIPVPAEDPDAYYYCCFCFRISFIRSCKCFAVLSPLLMLAWLACPVLAMLKEEYPTRDVLIGFAIYSAFFCFSCFLSISMWVGLCKLKPSLLTPYIVCGCIMSVFRFGTMILGSSLTTKTHDPETTAYFKQLENIFFAVNLITLVLDACFTEIAWRCKKYLRNQGGHLVAIVQQQQPSIVVEQHVVLMMP